MNNNTEQVRFSSAALIAQWAKERGLETTKKVNGKTVGSKRVRAEKQKTTTADGRKYKGMSGRITKDGSRGYFDVDERGRIICV